MRISDTLSKGTLEYFIKYNKELIADKYRLSEATPFKIDVMEKWIAIRDDYTYSDDIVPGEWEHLDIKEYHSKYGTNFIFIESAKKLWRIKTTGAEFYGSLGKMFNI